MPTSPNSLTTTAVLAPSGFASNSRISVVLPEPRTPVTTVTGMRAPRGRRCRRPNGLASVPANGSAVAGDLKSILAGPMIAPHPGLSPQAAQAGRGGARTLFPRNILGAFALQ